MNEEQLLYIKKGLKKLDLPHDMLEEITDHWACEIDELMIKGYTFEKSLAEVTKRWKKSFDFTEYYYDGWFEIPKILKDRMKTVNKKGIWWSGIFLAIFGVLYLLLVILLKNTFLFHQLIAFYLVGSSFIFLIEGMRIKKNSKASNIYSFMFTRKYKFVFSFLLNLLILWLASIDFLHELLVFYQVIALFHNALYFYYFYKYKQVKS